MMVCDDSTDLGYSEPPTTLAEALSKFTRCKDGTVRRPAYKSIPSLQEFVPMEQDVVDAEVCCYREAWVTRPYFPGNQFAFDWIGVGLSVEDIYRRVQNAVVATFPQARQVNINAG